VTLGVAGVGLIGGSIALRARERGRRVIGFDLDPRAAALVDEVAPSLDALGERARTLVLALPLDATLEAIRRLRGRSDYDLVLDVASVKVPVAEAAHGWAPFVATHPIAGAETAGPAAARADLFEGRTWAYVPAGDAQAAAAVDRARAFIETMGGRAFPVEAAAHDRALALTSHLPQVVVSVLAALVAGGEPPPELAGPGLASTLRLAGSPWSLWEPIVRANAEPLAALLRELGGRLQGLAADLQAGEVGRLASYFEDAHVGYERLVRARRPETNSAAPPLS